jgi:uncharacterized repeat protein (TIGR03803 family)
MKRIAVFVFCATMPVALLAQTFKTLHSFDGTDGANPNAPRVQAANGYLYGTAYNGGANGYGTIFKITPSGTLTSVYSFCSQSGCTDGANPNPPLVQAINGAFYGTTYSGGANGNGTVFKITPSGTLTTLHSFDGTDGWEPAAALVQATNGNLYGTTQLGGANNDGAVFKITPSGTLTTIYNFCSLTNCMDGRTPAGMVQGTDGDLYGTTLSGGPSSDGIVLKITPSDTLTTLYSFCAESGCPDGQIPTGLIQDTNGYLYGTTYGGGADGYGTVFALSVGLGPFVKTRPAVGVAGEFVEILGSDLTGATSVTFNGTAATFTVVSRTLITATVPAGATTGKIEVVTPGGTLSSNVSFGVL